MAETRMKLSSFELFENWKTARYFASGQIIFTRFSAKEILYKRLIGLSNLVVRSILSVS